MCYFTIVILVHTKTTNSRKRIEIALRFYLIGADNFEEISGETTGGLKVNDVVV